MIEQEIDINNCFICQKHKGKIEWTIGKIFREDQISVYHMEPRDKTVYLGYLFIELNRHIKGPEEMSDEEACAVGIMLKRISKVFKNHFDAEHIYTLITGDRIPHLHIHVIPRYKNTPKEFWGLKVYEWSGAPNGDRQAVESFCSEFAVYLQPR